MQGKENAGVEESLQWKGTPWQARLGLAFQGPATPGRGAGDSARGNSLRRHHREAPPFPFLEWPPAARWAPASEAFSVLAARGQHNGQRGPTWRGLQELM